MATYRRTRLVKIAGELGFKRGGLADDFIQGGLGDDQIIGDDEAYRRDFFGQSGNDAIFGIDGELGSNDLGDDQISPSAADDRISGNGGKNSLSGGSGNDVIFSGDAKNEPIKKRIDLYFVGQSSASDVSGLKFSANAADDDELSSEELADRVFGGLRVFTKKDVFSYHAGIMSEDRRLALESVAESDPNSEVARWIEEMRPSDQDVLKYSLERASEDVSKMSVKELLADISPEELVSLLRDGDELDHID